MPYLANGFQVAGFFHTTSVVDDLGAMADFHRNLFGVESVTLPYDTDNCRYASFAFVGDLCLDTICPEQDYDSSLREFRFRVGEHWSWPSVYIEDMQDCIYQLHDRHGLRLRSFNAPKGPVVGLPAVVAPSTNLSETMDVLRIVFTHPWETGIEWELLEIEPDFAQSNFTGLDGRWEREWSFQPPPPSSIGAEYHSMHTVVADDATLAARFLVDVCGGQVFHETDNTALGTHSLYISLGTRWPTTIEIAVPTRDGPARQDLQRNGNIYHCLTYKVQSLDKAADHLKRHGIGLETESEGLLVTDPRDCHGLRYGFTEELAPHDPRRQSGPVAGTQP
jgi:hypothetical protein